MFTKGGIRDRLPIQKKKIATAAILTLAIPAKPNHVFLGRATDSASMSVACTPGSTYTAEKDVTLYAVWQERNYDFSAFGLTVTPSEIGQYGKVTVKFRLGSWDRSLSYEDNINGRQHILLKRKKLFWRNLRNHINNEKRQLLL